MSGSNKVELVVWFCQRHSQTRGQNSWIMQETGSATFLRTWFLYVQDFKYILRPIAESLDFLLEEKGILYKYLRSTLVTIIILFNCSSVDTQYFVYLAHMSTSIEVLHQYAGLTKPFLMYKTLLSASAAVERLFRLLVCKAHLGVEPFLIQILRNCCFWRSTIWRY